MKKVGKLVLCKETLRALEVQGLRDAKGGESIVISWWPNECFIDSNPCQ